MFSSNEWTEAGTWRRSATLELQRTNSVGDSGIEWAAAGHSGLTVTYSGTTAGGWVKGRWTRPLGDIRRVRIRLPAAGD